MHRLTLVRFELPANELCVYFEDFEPQFLALLLYTMLVRSEQRLLVDLTSEYLVKVLRDKEYITKRQVIVYKFDRTANDQSGVTVA